MMEDSNKTFWRKDFALAVAAVLIFAAIVFISVVTSGCEFFRKLDKQTTTAKSDSNNVKREVVVASSVDTSKSKSASTKETVYYPQPIIVPGKDGETKIVFVPQTVKETGTEEKQNFNFDNYRRDLLDSIAIAQLREELNKKSETKGSLLGIGFWIGIAILGVVLIGLLFALVHFKSQLINIKSLITK